MAEEKIIIVNLRKELSGSPQWERSRRAVKILKRLILKKTKSQEIKIDSKINEKIWKRGIRHPKVKLKLRVSKENKKVSVYLAE